MNSDIRVITYADAVNEATLQLMEENERVLLIGLGVDTGVFNTTTKAYAKYPERVINTPIAENSMTGITLGASAAGMKVIMSHQRFDFLPMAMDQIINHLAKWNFLTNKKSSASVTIRAVIGHAVGGGWGQSCQHAQSFQALFAHIPGLKVVCPSSAYDAKGLLISCVRGSSPTLFIEHRRLHAKKDEVPESMYEVETDKAKVMRGGKDITIIGVSAMNIEIKQALSEIISQGIDPEWIDLRCISPLDKEIIFSSVEKTGRLLIVDTSHKSFGVGAEIIASIVEERPGILKTGTVQRISLPDLPIPAGPTIEKEYYPNFIDIINCVLRIMNRRQDKKYTLINIDDVQFKEAF